MVASTLWWLAGHHVVLTDSGPTIYPKMESGIKDTFADVTTWSIKDVPDHWELAVVMIWHGDHSDLPGGAVINWSLNTLIGRVHGWQELLHAGDFDSVLSEVSKIWSEIDFREIE